ncbi:coiled-coil domain-containing protein 83 [Megalops cyprinoides]|uniref:coiled-coil domain-containing protein 83 n=1 Tax=Megalops cyprinoides TaxID=118141 RepID=UPI001863DCB2|nr:coiled-coil domain-containing protein 83 [Megalops cyprinoides]
MKKTGGEDLTLAESYVTFQLQVKRKEIEDFENEISQLEEKNQRYKELKQQLKEEQMSQIRSLHKQLKDQEGKLAQKEVVCREQVEKAIQDNMELIRTDEEQVEELRSKLSGLEERVRTLREEKQIWLDYKLVGSQEHEQQIQVLGEKLIQLEEVFLEMKDDLERSMKENIKKIDEKAAQLMENEKSHASERAFKHLDKHSCQALKDNDWLKKTYAFYKEEVAFLEVDVRKLEEQNLELLHELFDHNMSDPKIFRNVSKQEAGLEVSDLICQPGKLRLFICVASRPRLPLRPAAETDGALERPAELESGGVAPSCSWEAPRPTGSPPEDLCVLLYGSQGAVQDRIQPGSLKRLTMIGRPVPLHRPRSADDRPSDVPTPDSWPVTTRMILDRFK